MKSYLCSDGYEVVSGWKVRSNKVAWQGRGFFSEDQGVLVRLFRGEIEGKVFQVEPASGLRERSGKREPVNVGKEAKDWIKSGFYPSSQLGSKRQPEEAFVAIANRAGGLFLPLSMCYRSLDDESDRRLVAIVGELEEETIRYRRAAWAWEALRDRPSALKLTTYTEQHIEKTGDIPVWLNFSERGVDEEIAYERERGMESLLWPPRFRFHGLPDDVYLKGSTQEGVERFLVDSVNNFRLSCPVHSCLYWTPEGAVRSVEHGSVFELLWDDLEKDLTGATKTTCSSCGSVVYARRKSKSLCRACIQRDSYERHGSKWKSAKAKRNKGKGR